MRATENGVTIRRRSEVALGLLLTSFTSLVLLYFAARGVPEDETFGDFLGVLAFGSVVLWFTGGILTSKVVVNHKGIVVQNWFNRYWIPRGAVVEIEVEPAVSVVLADGGAVKLAVGGDSLLNRFRGNRYQRRIRARIQEVWESVPADSTEATVEHTRRLGVLRLVVWASLFFGMAFFMMAFG